MTRARSRSQPADRPPELADVLTGLSRQNSVYRRTIAVCDQLADTALKGVDPAELTRVFAELVGKRIVLLDPAFRTRARAGGDDATPFPEWDRADPSVERLLGALEAQRRPLRVPSVPGSSLAQGCLVTPIVIGENTLGYLLVLAEPDDSHPDDVDLLTATYAATLFALTLAHERTSTELGLRYLATVVDALVSGHFLDAHDARDKARSLGLVDSRGFRVCVIRRDNPGLLGADDHDAGEILATLALRLPEARVSAREFGAVAIVPERDQRSVAGTIPQDCAPSWQEIWNGLSAGGSLTGGLSEPVHRPELAPVGYSQAVQAVDLGLRLGRSGELIDYHDLGIYRLLLRIGDMAQLWRFAEEVLGYLISYDAAHGTDLVTTLSVYLRNQSSPKRSARVLRVHPNTVAYRAQRIESITGLDLADADDRLLAQVAVTIVEAQMGQDSARS
ncbi:MAG: helix-turn-helix domain-containing protein [Actinomycetota bacterium]|nr:helix-turn-helix domain-containing protein [Actinomycetota bacterium]